MSTDPAAGSGRSPGAWGRLWAWLQAFETAMETTYDDLQDRRLIALEREMAEVRAALRTAPSAVAPQAESNEGLL